MCVCVSVNSCHNITLHSHTWTCLQFKDRGANGYCSVPLETRRDDRENLLSNCHLKWIIVPCSLHLTHIHSYGSQCMRIMEDAYRPYFSTLEDKLATV